MLLTFFSIVIVIFQKCFGLIHTFCQIVQKVMEYDVNSEKHRFKMCIRVLQRFIYIFCDVLLCYIFSILTY